MEKKTSFIEIVLTVVVIYLVIDFIGCMAWGLSGQFPADSFYIGAISRNILQALLF
jgi:hypothetical protein